MKDSEGSGRARCVETYPIPPRTTRAGQVRFPMGSLSNEEGWRRQSGDPHHDGALGSTVHADRHLFEIPI